MGRIKQHVTEAYARQKETLSRVKSTPRTRLAARLYASGIMNQQEAAKAAGLTANYLCMLKNSGNKDVNDIIARVDAEMSKEVVDMMEVKRILAHRALRNLGALMENGEKEEIRFKAAQDLADRHSDTAKTQQVDVRGMMVKGDAKELAMALVEAARLRGSGVPLGNFVKVSDTVVVLPAEADASNG